MAQHSLLVGDYNPAARSCGNLLGDPNKRSTMENGMVLSNLHPRGDSYLRRFGLDYASIQGTEGEESPVLVAPAKTMPSRDTLVRLKLCIRPLEGPRVPVKLPVSAFEQF